MPLQEMLVRLVARRPVLRGLLLRLPHFCMVGRVVVVRQRLILPEVLSRVRSGCRRWRAALRAAGAGLTALSFRLRVSGQR
jgi:hypothetical protein